MPDDEAIPKSHTGVHFFLSAIFDADSDPDGDWEDDCEDKYL